MIACLSACTSLRTDANLETGSIPICAPGVDLADTFVLLKTDWRPDQKKPTERERMAREVLQAVFAELPCGRHVPVNDAGRHRVDTLVEITLREFGPELVLSVPVLWSTNTDVDATIRITDARSGEIVFSASERRKEGGAFAVKSLSDVPGTFEGLLKEWIGIAHERVQS